MIVEYHNAVVAERVDGFDADTDAEAFADRILAALRSVDPLDSSALRREVIEECAKVADAYAQRPRDPLYSEGAYRRLAAEDIASLLRALATGDAPSDPQGPTFDEVWGVGRDHRPEASSTDLIREMYDGWGEDDAPSDPREVRR